MWSKDTHQGILGTPRLGIINTMMKETDDERIAKTILETQFADCYSPPPRHWLLRLSQLFYVRKIGEAFERERAIRRAFNATIKDDDYDRS